MSELIKKSGIIIWDKDSIEKAPKAPGVFVLRNIPSMNGIVYIAPTSDLRKTLLNLWEAQLNEIAWFDWYEFSSIAQADKVANKWIEKYTPKYNERLDEV